MTAEVETAPPASPTDAPLAELDADVRRIVPCAVRLGWQVVKLRSLDRVLELEAEPGERAPDPAWLPVVHTHDRALEVRLRLLQVNADIGRIWDRDRPPTSTGWLDSRQEAEFSAEAVRRLHLELLERLATSDFRVRHGYELGVRLAQLVILSRFQERASFEEAFAAARVRSLSSTIADLRSGLPPYSGTAVQLTLEAWQRWCSEMSGRRVDPVQVDAALYRQGEIWLALLSGEKEARDLLTIQGYVEAATAVLAQIAGMAVQFLRYPAGVLLTSVFLAMATVAILLARQSQNITPAAATLLGSLGITTATVAAAVRKALSNVERSLWEAELDACIALAAQRLPVPTRRAERLQRAAKRDNAGDAYA